MSYNILTDDAMLTVGCGDPEMINNQRDNLRLFFATTLVAVIVFHTVRPNWLGMLGAGILGVAALIFLLQFVKRK